MPRIRIAWVMVFVALAALNFAAFRAAVDAHSITGILLALGAMPTATVLAIGLIIGYRRHGSRPFLACMVGSLWLLWPRRNRS